MKRTITIRIGKAYLSFFICIENLIQIAYKNFENLL